MNNDQNWTFLEKLVFRFSFSLLILFMFFFNNGTLPFLSIIGGFIDSILHQFIPWLAKSWHLSDEVSTKMNGSGDTTYHYMMLLFIGLIVPIVVLIWSLVDRKSKNYQPSYYWLTVCVRFYVGLMLINYGLVKVVQLQFPLPAFGRLLTTYGESSPMGLAWTFLGFSKGYNLFMGIAELMAGLLLFRRTVAIGAIITLMTTANVMAVNYFYDVPVKIVSTALVLMCLFLLLPNFKRLFKLFFIGEGTTLIAINPPIIKKRWKRNTKYTLKYLLIALMVLGGIFNVYTSYSKYGAGKPKSPLYGAYKVDKFIRGNKIVLAGDSTYSPWQILILQGIDNGAIKDANGLAYAEITTDTVSKKISFVFANDPDAKQELNYEKNGERLILKGKFYGTDVNISLTKMKFQLIDRKLNWINETPYNR
ncbi:hypothetical protein [Pedobacter cryotolerans]|uniref:DoxX family protein n=1 Tax=Pedobacter cryotolerans TaxID=2571270 RepID=A0A4U1C1H4_9SPHI|nr:hypothetical protein [Pedobacter cryotolerans]TKB99479.1 hypothetical protein FA045_13445 [Pedobacter cryotolerans]